MHWFLRQYFEVITNPASDGVMLFWETKAKFILINFYILCGYLPPLKALDIPEDALSIPGIDSIAQDRLKQTIIYLLTRELGYLYLNRGILRINKTVDENSSQIIQSDAFALEQINQRYSNKDVGVFNRLSDLIVCSLTVVI